MGGSSYSRDVYSSSSSSSWGTSSTSVTKLSNNTLDGSMKSNGKVIKSTSKNPIVIVLDVTGSNIDFARLVYDKMPMFYGQIEEKQYLKDFDIAILAIGDVGMGDSYPLQIGDFAKGIEIDSWLERLVLEGHGGGNRRESYELAAHYLNECCEFEKDAEPIVFFIGDEAAYDEVKKKEADEYGIPCSQNHDPFPKLIEKFDNNVFMLLNKYCGRDFESDITNFWQRKLPSEHTIKIKEEKSIVDLMLGIIALLNKRRLAAIETDMLLRGQTHARLTNVRDSLLELSRSTELAAVPNINTDVMSLKKTNKANKGKRI